MVFAGGEVDEVCSGGVVDDILEELEPEAFGPAGGVDDEREVGVGGAVGGEEVRDAGDVVAWVIAGGGKANVVGAEGGGVVGEGCGESGCREEVQGDCAGRGELGLTGVDIEVAERRRGRVEEGV